MVGTWKDTLPDSYVYLYNGKYLTSDSLDINFDGKDEFALGCFASCSFSEWLGTPMVRRCMIQRCRFTGVDPISEQFAHLSTYNYASDNPISNVDLHGLQGVNFTEFMGEVKDKGFFKAVGEYFNFSSLSMGSTNEKIQTLSKVYNTNEAINNVLDVIDNSLQQNGDVASKIKTTSNGFTAVSGGITTLVTGTVAGIAGSVETGALIMQGAVDYARDGKVDEKGVDLLFKGIFIGAGQVVNKGVDALKISGTKNPVHAKQSASSVKAVGNSVVETVENVVEKRKNKER